MSPVRSAGPALLGLVPAAGRAMRLGAIAGSKEMLPVPGRRDGRGRPRPAIEHLLGSFRRARAGAVLVVLRAGKWDIPEALGDGRRLGLGLAYVVTAGTSSVAATLDRAWPWSRGWHIAFGFPDLLFDPPAAMAALAARASERDEDVVLGLVPGGLPRASDRVELGVDGRVRRVIVRGGPSRRRLTWFGAVWSPRFTEFLHASPHREPAAGAPEPALGLVIDDARRAGLRVAAVHFPAGACLDIGTPAGLERARGGGW